jgi:hypothetical protein
MKRHGRSADKGDPHQLQIDWNISSEDRPEPLPVPVTGEVVAEKPATASTAPDPVRPVTVKTPRTKPRQSTPATTFREKRIVARLPVPRPLPTAVAAGRFGQDEEERPIRPDPDEVQAITENQAEKLIDMLDAAKKVVSEKSPAADSLPGAFRTILDAYARDFGDRAAQQLEAYVRRQSSLEDEDRADYGWHR